MISRGNSRYMLQEFSSTDCATEVKKITASTTNTDNTSPTTDKRPIRVSPSGKVAHEFGIVDPNIRRKPTKLPSIKAQDTTDVAVELTKMGIF